MPPIPDTRVQTPKTLKELGRSMSRHLPRRLAQLRAIGKQTRALSGGRPKR